MLLSALREYDLRDYDHERAQRPNPIGTPSHHRIPTVRFRFSNSHATASKGQKGNSMAKEKAKAAEKKEAPKMLGTKEVAAKLKVDPKYLRMVLRDAGKKAGEGDEGGRYQWKPDADLSKLKKMIDDYAARAEKRADEKAKDEKPAAKKSGKKKPAKKAKAKKEEEEEEVEEEEVEEEDAEELT